MEGDICTNIHRNRKETKNLYTKCNGCHLQVMVSYRFLFTFSAIF